MPTATAAPRVDTDIVHLKMLRAGKWESSGSSRTSDVFNPSTGAVIARVPLCTADETRKVIAAVEAEAAKNKWPVAITVVDGAGHLVAFARMDNTQFGSVEVSPKVKVSSMPSGRLIQRQRSPLRSSVKCSG